MKLDLQRCSALLGALRGWADAVEAAPFSEPLTPGRRIRFIRILQRPEALQTMLTLAEDATNGGSGLSINKLAGLNWPDRVAAMSNNMRDVTLPALVAKGWVDGYQARQGPRRPRYTLKLSEAGADVLASYLKTKRRS